MEERTRPSLVVGMVLFPGLTQLDLTGPYEVFSRMPGSRVHLLAATMAPVKSEWGLTMLPDTLFANAGALDILCVPGGWGVNEQLENEELLTFLRDQGSQARYVTSVCSGALLLGAAGLIRGYRATTHWMSLDMLSLFGAHPVDDTAAVLQPDGYFALALGRPANGIYRIKHHFGTAFYMRLDSLQRRIHRTVTIRVARDFHATDREDHACPRALPGFAVLG